MRRSQISKYVRELAKTDYYQTLYAQTKELHFKLFKNNEDLSDIQIEFLGYLAFYSNLFMDIALGEVDEIVLKDEIYEDAYVYYKQHKRYEEKEEYSKIKSGKQSMNKREKPPDTIQWVFKKKPKKVT